MNKLQRSLYRTFLKTSSNITARKSDIYLQHRLDPNAEINWLYFDSAANNSAIINNMLSWPKAVQDVIVPELESRDTRWISGPEVTKLVKKAFRVPVPKEESDEYIDFALEAIREINLILKLSTQTSVVRDASGLVVTCTSLFSEDDSQLQFSHYTHFYRITIENQGDLPVKLLNRSWIFCGDGTPPVILPRWAPGVVGEQPLLSKGEGFHYMSSTRIQSISGYMEGTFQFSNAKGELFEVPVGKCALTNAKFG